MLMIDKVALSHVDAGVLRVAYYDLGPNDGPVAILLHGFPYDVHAYVEVPTGFHYKYEFDHLSGFLKLDRVLHSAVHYPADYGFVPRTMCGE